MSSGADFPSEDENMPDRTSPSPSPPSSRCSPSLSNHYVQAQRTRAWRQELGLDGQPDYNTLTNGDIESEDELSNDGEESPVLGPGVYEEYDRNYEQVNLFPYFQGYGCHFDSSFCELYLGDQELPCPPDTPFPWHFHDPREEQQYRVGRNPESQALEDRLYHIIYYTRGPCSDYHFHTYSRRLFAMQEEAQRVVDEAQAQAALAGLAVALRGGRENLVSPFSNETLAQPVSHAEAAEFEARLNRAVDERNRVRELVQEQITQVTVMARIFWDIRIRERRNREVRRALDAGMQLRSGHYARPMSARWLDQQRRFRAVRERNLREEGIYPNY